MLRQGDTQSMYLNIHEENVKMKSKFGWIKANGIKYENDIILHTDGSITKRQKKKSKDLKPIYGHTPLSEHELDFLLQENPQVVYVGIGHQSARAYNARSHVNSKKI